MIATGLDEGLAELKVQKLTAPELAVAWLLTLGASSESICKRLGIVNKTLEVRRKRIKAKFGNVPTYGIPLVMIMARGFQWPQEFEDDSV